MKLSMHHVIFPVFFLTSWVYSHAQLHDGSYHTAEGFDYEERVIQDNTGDKDLPVLVAFHFSSSTPEEAAGYYDSLGIPVRIILPRGNYRKRAGYSYFPPDHYTKDSVTQMRTVRSTVDSVASFLRAIGKKYNTKPVVSGISQGGDISLLLAIHYPDLIKASFPLLGFVHRQVYETLKKPSGGSVPVFMYQGEDDKIVSVNYTRKEIAFLRNIFQVTLTVYPHLEHDVSPAMEREYSALMRTWLGDKRK